MIKNFLNTKDHQNPIIVSKVMAILLKGWILALGGASAVEGLRSTGLPGLVSVTIVLFGLQNIAFCSICIFNRPGLVGSINFC